MVLKYVAIMGGVLACASAARAAIDQANVLTVSGTGSVFAANVYSSVSQAQTFTVGITGRLTEVDLQLWRHSIPPTQDLLVDIATTDGGNVRPIGEGVLATATLHPLDVTSDSDLPHGGLVPLPFVAVDLTGSDVEVVSGQRLTIVLRTASTDFYQWGSNPLGDTYSGGSGFNYIGGVWTSASIDMGFRTVVAVPEAGTLGVLAVGVVGVMRRRRRGLFCRGLCLGWGMGIRGGS